MLFVFSGYSTTIAPNVNGADLPLKAYPSHHIDCGGFFVLSTTVDISGPWPEGGGDDGEG